MSDEGDVIWVKVGYVRIRKLWVKITDNEELAVAAENIS